MKKAYIKPQIEIEVISTSQLICASLGMGGTTNGNVTEADSPEMLDLSDLVPGIPSYVFE